MANLLSKARVHRSIVLTLLATLAMVPAVEATYMLAKAQLAQTLIKQSWNKNGAAPWPWADTKPVARLVIPSLALDTYVLQGASGATLAFGPGMLSGSTPPGAAGVSVIAAHRDTHFKPLENIKNHDIVKLQTSDQRWHQYRVKKIGIADVRTDTITPHYGNSRLLLVTCFPFDGSLPGGPLRYVVEADYVTDDS